MNFADFGFLRVAAVAPAISLADPMANAQNILEHYQQLLSQECSIVLTPELSLTGYSCEDLFHTDDLLHRSSKSLEWLASKTKSAALVVGSPYRLMDGRVVNCAFICSNGMIQGSVPKSVHPNYREFYEKRWFASGEKINVICDYSRGNFLINPNQLFKIGATHFAIEICEDLWAPRPPGVEHALAGATILLNPSASTELIGKADYRRDLVRMQSAKTISGYLYAGAGITESTKDAVYGGHLLAAENGHLLAESERFKWDTPSLIVDFDWRRLNHERAFNTTFAQTSRNHSATVKDLQIKPVVRTTTRVIEKHPFVPQDETEIDARANEIFAIQTAGLARRMMAAKARRLVIGLSGGLDSTLAFLVCCDALKLLDLEIQAIDPLTMPGPGTTQHTLDSVRLLSECTGVSVKTIPISAALDQHLSALEHDGSPDVTYENAQARERTQILFDEANKVDGIVVGTGDLSELALGWCTFNADHMSSYNVNASVPKTLVAYLVRWYAKHRSSSALSEVLQRIAATPITPELKPHDDGEISQHTEVIIGPYELHDFFLYHYLRHGSDALKIYKLAQVAFGADYTSDEIKKYLRLLFTRFFSQQFKRTTMPPGPKVGTISLSPRGDWRMPDEAESVSFLSSIDEIT